MSLTRSLTRPVVKPLVSPLGGDTQAIIDARQSLVVKYPLKSDLNSDPVGSQGVLASSQKIYRDASGKWVAADPNSPAVTGLSTLLEGDSTNLCSNYNFSPDLSVSGVIAGTDVTVSRVLASDYPDGFLPHLIDEGVLNGYVFLAESTRVNNLGYVIFQYSGGTGTSSGFLWVKSDIDSSIGLRYSGSDVDVKNLSANVWHKLEFENATGSSTGAYSFRFDSNAKIQFIGNQIEPSTTYTSPIVVSGSSSTRLADDLQLPTTGWPVNDCTLFFCGYGLNSDIGVKQTIIESDNISIYLDELGDNWVADVNGSQSIINGFNGLNCLALQVDSSNNMTLFLGDQVGNTVSLGAPLSWGATAQIANSSTLNEPCRGFYYNLKVFNSLVAIENAIWA